MARPRRNPLRRQLRLDLMNDPHVVSLEYALETDDTLAFDNPAPVDGDTPGFTYRLADGVLTVTLKDHYPTEKEAIAAVRPFTLAWELDYALERGRRELRFRFVRSDIIDRKPPPGAVGSIMGLPGVISATGYVARLRHTWKRYPTPPTAFAASADVETLWTRYENQLLGREYLPAMGYFCLTVIETLYGATPSSSAVPRRRTSTKRKRAAVALNVEPAVLEKLGELTTERGDSMTARKHEAGSSFRPLTAQEAEWIQAALRGVMRRLGMKAAGVTSAPLKMGDLPKL